MNNCKYLLGLFYAVTLSLVACGDPQLKAPLPLIITDISPSNGARFETNPNFLVTFSEPMDRNSLANGLRLETDLQEGPNTQITIQVDAIDEQALTVQWSPTTELPEGQYRITLDANIIVAQSGTRLNTNIQRRFIVGFP